jgi:hypothetical protein
MLFSPFVKGYLVTFYRLELEESADPIIQIFHTLVHDSTKRTTKRSAAKKVDPMV